MSGSGPYQEDPNAGRPDLSKPGGAPPPPPSPADPSAGWNAPPPPPPGQAGWGGTPAPQAGFGGGGPMSAFGRPLAEWWKRLVAFIIDGVIVGVPLSIILNLIGLGAASSVDPNTGLPANPGLFGGAFLGTFLLSIILPIVYFGVMNGSEKGQTVGKMVMKIQVREEMSGGPIGIGKGFLRYLVYGALSMLCGIGAIIDGLFPLWDAKRQTIHDKAVKSVVVDAA